MAKASALLVGLKSVDPASYNGWDGTAGCWGCELDVDNIGRILSPLGYEIKTLKTAEATRNGILASLYRASENTAEGDIFVFYYSGHGGQQPDLNGDEVDGQDETLVAYDREVIDDKIHEALTRFKPGVRVVMISDSCNSGSNYRGRMNVPLNNEAIFRPVATKSNARVNINAQLIHIGGCRDGFTSAGYHGGGAFTMALCNAWQDGEFTGTFEELHGKIRELITTSQQPQYNEYGQVSDAFRNQQAFAVPSPLPDEGPVELTVMETEPTEGEISESGQKDEYTFKVKKAGEYTIQTTGRTDLIMSLFGPDSKTTLVAKDDDSGEKLNPKIVADLVKGTYYVVVQHYSNTGTGGYSIKVSK
jgi:hypothetical protein